MYQEQLYKYELIIYGPDGLGENSPHRKRKTRSKARLRNKSQLTYI